MSVRQVARALVLVLPLVAVGTSAQAAPTVERTTTTVASGGFYEEGAFVGDLSLSASSLYLQYEEPLGDGCRRSVAVYGEAVDQAVAGRVQVVGTTVSLPPTDVPVVVSEACFTPDGDYVPGSGDDSTVVGTLAVDVVGDGATRRERTSTGSIRGEVVYGGIVQRTDAVGRVSLSAGALELQRSTDYAVVSRLRQVVVER